MKRITGLAVVLAMFAGCSGNDEVIPIDAAVAVDGAPDAAIDAPIDAPAGAQMCLTSVAALTVAEGASGTFAVTLAEAPAASVTVDLASANVSAATAAPATLTFTAANFNVPQTVTVSGVEDADPNDETTTVMCTSAGIPAATVAVTVTDND